MPRSWTSPGQGRCWSGLPLYPSRARGTRKGTVQEGSFPGLDTTTSLQLNPSVRLQPSGSGATLTSAERSHGPPCTSLPPLTIQPPRASSTHGRPHPPPRAQRSPGARPALTSSMSRSRMLGGCGTPVAPSPNALSTSSSRHLIAASTGAMATRRAPPSPGLQREQDDCLSGPAAGRGQARE